MVLSLAIADDFKSLSSPELVKLQPMTGIKNGALKERRRALGECRENSLYDFVLTL